MSDDGIDFQPVAQTSDGIDFQPSEPSYLEKTASNVLPDLEDTVKGAAGSAATWAPFIGGDVASALPGLVKTGRDVLSNPQETAEAVARPVTHPIDYFQEHPVQQTLNALGGAGVAAEGVGALANKIPFTENMVPSVERIANNQTLKSMGGTMGQLGQMEKGSGGRAALDRAAEFARNKGLTDVFSTSIGREEALKNLLKESGEKVGALRTEAGAAPKGIIDEIVSDPKIDKYLGSGSASKEIGGVDTALNDIKEIGGEKPTHASLADAATYINKNAAGNKLYQPVNAETEVANILSDKNNAGIAQTLGEKKAKQYVEALGEQEKLHPLEHLQERGELREAGGRGGLGTRVIQAIADRAGYRITAKTAAALHDLLMGKGGPGALSKAALTRGLTVPGDVREWMTRKNDSE